jgi:hypothetical protein
LRFIDISDNNLDKRAVEHLVQGISDIGPESTRQPLSIWHRQDLTDRDAKGGDAVGPKDSQTELRVEEDDSKEEGTEETVTDEDEEIEGPFQPRATLLRDLGDNAEPSALTSLRMENCGLKSQALEALGERRFSFLSSPRRSVLLMT